MARFRWIQRIAQIACFARVVLSLCQRSPGGSTLAHDLHHQARLFRAELASILEDALQPRPEGGVLPGDHERERGKPLSYVMADRLSDLGLAARVVEHVVGDLERQPEVTPILSQP